MKWKSVLLPIARRRRRVLAARALGQSPMSMGARWSGLRRDEEFGRDGALVLVSD